MPLYEFGGKRPSIHPGALVAKTACLVGEVVVGEGTSIWPGAVLRG
ncbi:MAG: gamma carbonic anhydrase family protein, partial [Hadesarchaea archaeon]